MQNDKAEKIFTASLKHNPNNIAVYVVLATFSSNNGNKEEARKYIQKAIEIAEKNGNRVLLETLNEIFLKKFK